MSRLSTRTGSLLAEKDYIKGHDVTCPKTLPGNQDTILGFSVATSSRHRVAT